MQRPHRPFGVTLAIFASLLLFSIFPLLEVGLLLSVRLHFSKIEFNDDASQPLAMGTNFLGVPDSKIFLQAFIALIFLVIAVFAWRGRPAFMRYVLMVACGLLTLLNILNVVIGQLTITAANGISSLDGIINSLSLGQFVVGVVVTLYVVWYLNRGPARAFYRGYFLPVPEEINSSSPVTDTTS